MWNKEGKGTVASYHSIEIYLLVLVQLRSSGGHIQCPWCPSGTQLFTAQGFASHERKHKEDKDPIISFHVSKWKLWRGSGGSNCLSVCLRQNCSYKIKTKYKRKDTYLKSQEWRAFLAEGPYVIKKPNGKVKVRSGSVRCNVNTICQNPPQIPCSGRY